MATITSEAPRSQTSTAEFPSPATMVAREAAVGLAAARVAKPRKSRPMIQRPTYWVRRLHLYFGLFLLPWVILYGVTAYLFNHPSAWSDAPMTELGGGDLAATAVASQTPPEEVARRVVDELNRRATAGGDDSPPLELLGSPAAEYDDAYAFGSLKTPEKELSFLLSPRGTKATIREQPPRREEEAPQAKPPFAIDGRADLAAMGRGRRGGRGGGPASAAEGQPEDERGSGPQDPLKAPLMVAGGMNEIAEATLNQIAAQRKLAGDSGQRVQLTSVPDLKFTVARGEENWDVRYNALAGSVQATPAGQADPAATTSWRRYMTRLHTLHGYPDSYGARWTWAIIVDVMAFIMVFWGVSGLIMWWQIKATRKPGAVVLAVSGLTATWLAVAMNGA